MRIFGIRDRLAAFARDVLEAAALRERVDQLNTQLAGVTTAALGWSKGQEAKQGQYGWSPAYQDVLVLRQRLEALWERYAPMPGMSRRVRLVSKMACGFCGGVLWSADLQDRIVLSPGKEGETIRVTSDVGPDSQVRVRMIREPQGQLVVEQFHQCYAVRAIAT